MQLSRLFEIVYILLDRKQITAKALAERFEVSVRTIYRDIETLNLAGVPVYTLQGANGGIRIHDSYVLNKSALTSEEQDQILIALQGFKETGNADATRLVSRLGSMFGKEAHDWIEVDFSRWGNERHDQALLANIRNAIINKLALHITYYRGDGAQTVRTVFPVRLVYKSKAWYVQAFCLLRKDYRLFKLYRVTNVTLADEITLNEPLPPPPAKVSALPPEHGMPDCVSLVLHFEKQASWRVLDEFPLDQITWLDDGSLKVCTSIPEGEWLVSYLLSYGDTVTVLSPLSVREALVFTLQRSLLKHLEA